jgi:hypothetical protein
MHCFYIDRDRNNFVATDPRQYVAAHYSLSNGGNDNKPLLGVTTVGFLHRGLVGALLPPTPARGDCREPSDLILSRGICRGPICHTMMLDLAPMALVEPTHWRTQLKPPDDGTAGGGRIQTSRSPKVTIPRQNYGASYADSHAKRCMHAWKWGTATSCS